MPLFTSRAKTFPLTATDVRGLPWYCRPIPVVSLFVGVTFLVWLSLPADLWLRVTGSRKVVDLWGIAYYVAASACFVIGAFAASFMNGAPEPRGQEDPASRRPAAPPLRIVKYAAIVAWILAIVGYLSWFGIGVHRAGGPDVLLRRIFSAIGVVPLYLVKQELLRPVAGVTTLVHLAVPAVAFAALWWSLSRPHRTSFWPLAIIISLSLGAVLRAALIAERLALMEIAIPLLIIALFMRRKRSAFVVAVIPGVAILAVYGLFTLTEALRSWIVLGNQNESIWAFGFFRLAGYYAQALNSTVYIVTQELALETPFYFSLRWFWDYPLFSDHLWTYSTLAGTDPAAVTGRILSAPALNPEFTTFSTPGYLFLDFGWAGLGVAAGLGAAIQKLYDRVQRGSWRALLLYACLFVGVLEFPRILYWPEGRVFVIVGYIVLVLALHVLLRSVEHRGTTPAPSATPA